MTAIISRSFKRKQFTRISARSSLPCFITFSELIATGVRSLLLSRRFCNNQRVSVVVNEYATLWLWDINSSCDWLLDRCDYGEETVLRQATALGGGIGKSRIFRVFGKVSNFLKTLDGSLFMVGI